MLHSMEFEHPEEILVRTYAYNILTSRRKILNWVTVQIINVAVIMSILILLVFVFAKSNLDKWNFLDVLWIPT